MRPTQLSGLCSSSAGPAACVASTSSGRPDLVSRFMLRILDKQTHGGRIPDDLTSLRELTGRSMSPIWLSRLPLASVEQVCIPGPEGDLASRVYTPGGMVRGTLLYLHGGGFVHCGLDSHDGICCRLARASGCIVVAPSYRLAPEHQFPAARDDCLAALQWTLDHADSLGGREESGGPLIAIGGDSAGGNLAAVTCQAARDLRIVRPRFQLLYYPATHGVRDVPSRTAFADGYFLTASLMRWYLDQYLGDELHYEDPGFAPALGNLHDLPPTLVITAEFDPLHDEGRLYASMLQDAGSEAYHQCYSGTIHGFVSFYPLMAKGRKALAEGGRAIKHAMV